MRVEGIEVAMIDVDNDGVFDLIARDVDGDGYISEGEIAVMREPISVEEVAELPHADDYSDDFDDNGELALICRFRYTRESGYWRFLQDMDGYWAPVWENHLN